MRGGRAQISAMKNEPQWMRDFRLKALRDLHEEAHAARGAAEACSTHRLRQHLSTTSEPPTARQRAGTTCRRTSSTPSTGWAFPKPSRSSWPGRSAQYESEVVYHSIHKDLEAKGVIFLDMDSALREYPDLVKEYFGTIIPPTDNKFAALNSAVWSGGSFIYVPQGVHVEMPLQAYFRINTKNMGQFERTLIIVDEGA